MVCNDLVWASKFPVDGLPTLPDDPMPGPNQVLAHRMGIIMGTSHQEPMARSTEEFRTFGTGDWSFRTNQEYLERFWKYGAQRAKGLDTVFTIGMRGNGDLPLPGADTAVCGLCIVPFGQLMILTWCSC